MIILIYGSILAYQRDPNLPDYKSYILKIQNNLTTILKKFINKGF